MTVMGMRRTDPTLDAALDQLARRWPVGQHVQHLKSGLPGTVVETGRPEFPVLADNGAHAVISWHGPSTPCAVVAVEFRFDGGYRAVDWYRPYVLRRDQGVRP